VETVIAILIVVVAVAWAAWRIVRTARKRPADTGCATGCDGCCCGERPPSPPA
jgi:hypothetical protein